LLRVTTPAVTDCLRYHPPNFLPSNSNSRRYQQNHPSLWSELWSSWTMKGRASSQNPQFYLMHNSKLL